MHKFFTSPTKTACIVLAILVLFLYTLSPADDTSMVFMGCVFVHVIMIIAFAMIYEICSTRQARGRTSSTFVNHLIGCDTLHQYVPSSEAFPTRRRLQELRLQVALLDRELVEFENLTLSELPSASVFGIPSMNEEEINALPVHNYKGIGLESEDAPLEQGSFSAASAKGYWRIGITEEDPSCDESTCNICFEQVIKGDLVRSLPCLHQFHSRCINPWLAVNASCPICKIMLGSGAQQSIEIQE
ncbi:E3 ubiquitin-protein ligase SDIR1-like [Nicotiana tabacum]|uniref:E3 ubiquitin-protein ligase SDIR1-like n=1 Tax=Nicotiana tabacum TaxID=4097 RepID=A0AC58SYU6_TOBAC